MELVAKRKQMISIIEVISSIYWLTFLVNTDSYYVVYLFIGLIGGFCCYLKKREQIVLERKRDKLVGIVFSGILSLAIVFANYNVFATYFDLTGKTFEVIYASLSVVFVLIGGSCLIWSILICSVHYLKTFYWRQHDYTLKPSVVLGRSFIFISVIYLIIFFLFNYPGTITPDSVHQLREIMAKEYSNHHPFYTTMLIKVFFEAGMYIFQDINAAIAVYSVFQMLFMAACFAYVVVTVYQMKLSKKIVVGVLIFYTFMPYNIAYSSTMRKDAMFSAFIMVFIVAFFRAIKKIGKSDKWNYGMVFVSSMGICLFRNNGWLNFVFSVAVFVVLFRIQYKNMLVLFGSVTVVSFILINPVLDALNINDSDILESTAIPIQQIARVITECDDLTKEQKELLENIVDLERVDDTYLSYFVDPLKNLIREKQNVGYITEHKGEFLQLYIDLGLTHPGKYMAAWIDQTRGYWNGGYNYWRWEHGVQENKLGIYRTEGSYMFSRIMYEYLWIFQVVPMLYIFLCIGFWVWLTMYLGYIAYSQDNKILIFMTIPILGNIATLLIATPVFAEFRYAYSVFLCVPFLLLALFYRSRK